MKVCVRDHRGGGAPFADALTRHDLSAFGDVLLVDHEAPGPVYDRLFASHDRAFLYPHGAGPLVYTLYPKRPQTRGHFVIGSGQADLFARYDDRPTEVVGWPWGPLLPFRPTEGRKVLFAPTHPDGFGWLPAAVLDNEAATLDALAAMDVEVRVRRYPTRVPAETDIGWADVVVAAPGSFPSRAVALGCPTVVVGEDIPVCERHPVTRAVNHVPRFTELLPTFRFPNAPGTLAEQIRAACSDDLAADWRRRFVGERFDPVHFADVFDKAVEQWT